MIQQHRGDGMAFEAFEKLPEDRKKRIIDTGIREFSAKTFKDASTDRITAESQISKGILFHYFGSKKEFYFFCLEEALQRLTAETEEVSGNDFYEILFAEMDRKMALCLNCRDEMHMVNMASRDASAEIANGKEEIFRRYMRGIQMKSKETVDQAVAELDLKEDNRNLSAEGLRIYINALMNRYLQRYQEIPDQFFASQETIKQEMKAFIDLMLYGICR